jgi:hypothetical protein
MKPTVGFFSHYRVEDEACPGMKPPGMRSWVELEEKRRLGYVKRREGERELPLPRELWDRIPPDIQAALRVVMEGYEAHCDVRGRTRCAQTPGQSEFAELLPAPVERRARGETASAQVAVGPETRRPTRPYPVSAGVGTARAGAGRGALCTAARPPLWGGVGR